MKLLRNGNNMKDIIFLDLKAQYKEIKPDIKTAINRVVERQSFILGDELKDFEEKFAKYLGVKYVCGVNSGTDALILALKILGVGPGDEVITPTQSFIATTLAITEVGAKPIFVDSDPDSYLIDVSKIKKKITKKTKAILPVHLYGAPCNMEKIIKIANKYSLKVVEDACQSHGSSLNLKKLGTYGDVGTFSFYPGKNLGAYGDGGAMCTNDEKLYQKMLMIRNYGQKIKYHHEEIGVNSRLDGIQAAVLSIKLKHLDEWNKKRNIVANWYKKYLDSKIKIQKVIKGGFSCYHVFVVEVDDRDKLMAYLKENGVQTLIHYPIPIHLQECYKSLGHKLGDFSVAERASRNLVSLPIYPELDETNIKYICGLINIFCKK